MAFDSYTGLQAEITAFLWGRTDLADRVPGFIALCEAKMRRNIRTRQTVNQVPVSVSGETYPIPADLAEVMSLRLNHPDSNGGYSLDYATPEQMANYEYTGEAMPRLYTLVGDRLYFKPTPDQSYAGTMRYRATFPSLSASVATNWVLRKHPDAYLYGSLMASAPYLYDDGRLPMWSSLYEQAIAEANADQPVRQGSGVLRNDGLSRLTGGSRYNVYTDEGA